MSEQDLKKNGSGYSDPTAYKAIKRIEKNSRDRERVRKVIGCILRICELSGFELEGRLALRDVHTGKVWR